MDILKDDMRDLKACSLTCKAMFASTRYLIHRTLYVTWGMNEKILTPAEKEQYERGGSLGLDLRFLSFMGEHDLLKYARHLNIRVGSGFSPYALESHIQHFRSLDRIHTLTIHPFDARPWSPSYDAYFTQFYPTLTTLALHFHVGSYRFVMRFVVQFPNLENLTLNYLRSETWLLPGTSAPLRVSQPPPLRGHLRCSGLGPRRIPIWATELAFDLQNGINFRSVEFKDVHWERGQQILDGCASSLEEFAVHIIGNGEKESSPRSFSVTETGCTNSHLQGAANWVSSNSGKISHSDPSHSTSHFPPCPKWR